MLAVVDTLIEIGDTTEDWNVRKAWLNSVLNELWTARGPYPGFPSVLEALGLHNLVSSYMSLTNDEDMKTYRDDVRSFLDRKIDKVAGNAFSKSDLRIIRREYQLMGKIAADFALDVLSRFDLSASQVKAILDEGRENVSITASIEQMAKNPYIIFEQYRGYDSDDTIPFYRIDNGVIPSPEYGVEEIFDAGAIERLRAFCVDELNKIAAHSFGKAEMLLQSINARLDRMPEWKRYMFKLAHFGIDRDILDEALVQKTDDENTLYLYLKEVYEDERAVEKALRELADRPDIPLRMAITPDSFKKELRISGSPLEKKVPDQYDAILDNQANICMKIFAKPLCVLSGAAGTGKTTVIKASHIYYIVCEHSTEKDSLHDYEVTKYWNTAQGKSNLMSYHKRMKNSVALKRVYILDINNSNKEYLSQFKQGINSNGKPREPKIMIEQDNLLIMTFQINLKTCRFRYYSYPV